MNVSQNFILTAFFINFFIIINEENIMQSWGYQQILMLPQPYKFISHSSAGVTDRLGTRLQTAIIGFDSRPRPDEDRLMRIYNTMSGDKEPLQALHPNRINLFVCGPTVYDDAHIGHARTYIAFDVVARYLKYRGFSVFYLQNITDVDDKVINRAKELGVEPAELARKFEKRYMEDMHALGVKNVNLYARATEHIPEIIEQVRALVEKGYAYETETGVYFEEPKFEDFGKLSHQTLEAAAKQQIEPDPTKKNPGDFSLWKKREEGKEITWDSPWGRGRPGWHIEDTAITETYFGPQYDVHGGARDLIFPHHEAEISQMEAASGKKPMVRCWMHTGFLNVGGEKMSKSLGNFVTIRDLLKRHDPQTFRLFVLSTHYRSPIDFNEGLLEQSQRNLERIRQLIRIIDEQQKSSDTPEGSETPMPEEAKESGEAERALADARKKFIDAMEDDFNTPWALSAIFDLVRDSNRSINDKTISSKSLHNVKQQIIEFGEILGLSFSEASAAEKEEDMTSGLIELLVEIRQKLREKRDWELADEIRDRLRDLNIVLEDTQLLGKYIPKKV